MSVFVLSLLNYCDSVLAILPKRLMDAIPEYECELTTQQLEELTAQTNFCKP